MSNIVKELQKIAARKLRNTRGVPRNMKDKLELIELAFGHGEVTADFEKWCDENVDRNPQYPVTEYLRGIDARLGSAPRVDPGDERIAHIQALVYELTSCLPRSRAIRDLLVIHSAEEIEAALREYIMTVDEKDWRSAIRSFFDDLGCSAVIYSMRKRSQKDGKL
jgi:hypothetical protein